MATSIFSIVLTMSAFMQLLYQNSFVFILALQYRYNMSVMDTSIYKYINCYICYDIYFNFRGKLYVI